MNYPFLLVQYLHPMPGTAFCTLHKHPAETSAHPCEALCCPHFTDGETEALRGEIT